MPTIQNAIQTVRESVIAIGRVHQVRPERIKKGKVKPAQWNIAIVGSGWCVVEDSHVVTAHHVFNGDKPRDPKDKFYVFSVPGNGEKAFRYPVTGFPLEEPDLDLAVLEIGRCESQGAHSLPALPITYTPLQDGDSVVTVGFPAPEVQAANLDAQGNWLGAQMFLKSHANQGIVSAQYVLGQLTAYELNVGWHHGESGGPVVRLNDPLAAFSVMQHYRNVSSPHGVVAGPHRGLSLSHIQGTLQGIGATEV